MFAILSMSHSHASVDSATGYKLSVKIRAQPNGANASICTSERNMQHVGYNRARISTDELLLMTGRCPNHAISTN
jgi:hypothetical protein